MSALSKADVEELARIVHVLGDLYSNKLSNEVFATAMVGVVNARRSIQEMLAEARSANSEIVT